MPETNLKQELITYAREIQAHIDRGWTLKQIQQWSYRERECGRNVPYLATGTTGQSNPAGNNIYAAPTKAQPELKEFFDRIAPGCARLTEYVFRVHGDGVLEFTQRSLEGVDADGKNGQLLNHSVLD